MTGNPSNPANDPNRDHMSRDRSSALVGYIFNSASRGTPAAEFLREVSRSIVDYVGCDLVEIRIVEGNKLVVCKCASKSEDPAVIDVVPGRRDAGGWTFPCLEADTDLEIICGEVVAGRTDPSLPFFTVAGSFWIGNAQEPLDLSSETCKWSGGRAVRVGGDYRSLAVVPFRVRSGDNGLLLLKSMPENSFTPGDVEFFEFLARIVGIASTQRRAQIALRERVKELTCLFGIARVAAKAGQSLDEMLNQCVALLPPAWLHEREASASIEFDGRSYSTWNFRESASTQTADILVKGQKRGVLKVAYPDGMPELDEGPFLKEERNLIDAIARELALLMETRQMEEERYRLQEQLRHADRLATIGQLAAGIAHELNEPLAAILGLAQLSGEIAGLPDQARKDNERIIAASLHAREIIQKLKLFARQAPTHKAEVDLNDVVRDCLYLVEPRCENAGVVVVSELDPDPPQVLADAGQLCQVLVNLVVNAIQAMPQGGRVTIRTESRSEVVALQVEDTGIGMDEKTLRNIFVPFFTTKDVDEGTGLGLSVVQGIVESHGGTIAVESEPGLGARFEIRLPRVPPENHGSQRETNNDT